MNEGIFNNKKLDHDKPFKLHQVYEEEGDTKHKVCECGCKFFSIGLGDYFVSSRCLQCHKEEVLSDG